MPTTSSIIEGTGLRIAPDDFPNPIVDLPPDSPGAPPATAVLAGGCFWCTEAVYRELDGVLAVTPGYAGGTRETANYETVSSGPTKHAEAIRIAYDPARLTYGQLLKIFFSVAHDPTERNRQGNDVGPQYRSTLFPAGADQRRVAEAYVKQLDDAGAFTGPIATTIEPDAEFYEAETYHTRLRHAEPHAGIHHGRLDAQGAEAGEVLSGEVEERLAAGGAQMNTGGEPAKSFVRVRPHLFCKTRFFTFPDLNADEVQDGSARPNLDVRPHDLCCRF